MGADGKKKGNTLRFQSKVRKHFCTKFVRLYDFYVIYCSKSQDRGLIIKIPVNTTQILNYLKD